MSAQGNAPETNAALAVNARDVVVMRGDARVVDGASLQIERGSPYAIVGESGAGKTSLLMALTGLWPLAKGSVSIDGKPINSLSRAHRARTVGVVFQDYQLFSHLSVVGNLVLAPKLHGADSPEPNAERCLERLGIATLGGRHPHELSGGQKQRVAIARALVLSPRVLFFDEPSAALDPATTGELAKLLTELSSETQIVIVSHDRPFLEGCAPRGCRMRAGRIDAEGDLASLF